MPHSKPSHFLELPVLLLAPQTHTKDWSRPMVSCMLRCDIPLPLYCALLVYYVLSDHVMHIGSKLPNS